MDDNALSPQPAKGKFKPILYWVSAYVIIIIGINCFVGPPVFNNEKDALKYNYRNKRYDLVAIHYNNLLDKYPLKPAYHYHYLYFWNEAFKDWIPQNVTLAGLLNRYNDMSKSKYPDSSYIGKFGLGMLYTYSGDFKNAENKLGQIQGKSSWYYKYALAIYYEKDSQYEKAESLLEQDLKNSKYTDVFYKALYLRLSNIYNWTRNYQKLGKLINEATDKSLIPYEYQANYYLYKGNLPAFLVYKALYLGTVCGPYEILNDLSITFLGLFILFRIMRRKSIRPGAIFLVFVFSFVFYEIIFGLINLTHYPFYNANDGSAGKFLYYFLFLGPREELTKIIPFLFLLSFTKLIRQPIDYLFYASLCGLTFAVRENLIYFYWELPPVASVRGLDLIAGHILYTCLVAYGVYIGRGKPLSLKILYFSLFFIVASFIHGWYDFWPGYIRGEHFYPSLLFIIINIVTFALLVKDCLLKSEQSLLRNYDRINMVQYLIIAFLAFIVSDYVISSFVYGPGFINPLYSRWVAMYVFRCMVFGACLAFITVPETKGNEEEEEEQPEVINNEYIEKTTDLDVAGG